MTQVTKRVLLIDDDRQNNMLSKIILRRSLPELEFVVTEFTDPEKGLEYIETKYMHEPHHVKTTLFLDINMPTLTGWEFLEKFEALKESIKNNFEIYILSSSINPMDIQRAKSNPLVIDFIEKPLKAAILVEIFK